MERRGSHDAHRARPHWSVAENATLNADAWGAVEVGVVSGAFANSALDQSNPGVISE
jgi:hypothetical protein